MADPLVSTSSRALLVAGTVAVGIVLAAGVALLVDASAPPPTA